MVADDLGASAFALERLDVIDGRGFQIENDRMGMVFRDGATKLIDGSGYVNPMKRVAQRRGKHLGDLGVALEQDYVDWLHMLLLAADHGS